MKISNKRNHYLIFQATKLQKKDPILPKYISACVGMYIEVQKEICTPYPYLLFCTQTCFLVSG